MSIRLQRAEVAVQETWNLDDLFPSLQDWETAMNQVAAGLPSVTQYQDRLGEGPRVLLACLDAQEALLRRLAAVMAYASLRYAADGASQENQVAADRARTLTTKIYAQFSFIRSELLQLPEGTINNYLEAEPGLAVYRRFLDRLDEEKPYTLSPETEQVLASLGQVLGAPYTVYRTAKGADIQLDPAVDGNGNELPMSFGLYDFNYEESGDAVLRRSAFASLVKGLGNHRHSLAAAFATEVGKNVTMARLRNHPSTTHMLLHRQEVSEDVYTNVLDIILAELPTHMRRYARLRQRVLGLEKLPYWDLKAPLDPDFEPSLTYEQAGEQILAGLEILGPEYTDIMATALRERWVDRADNIGKQGGAFCNSGAYDAHAYILMTWGDSLRSMFTLVHELGHAGHGMLRNRYQRYANTPVSTFFIEAPSTLNELLVGNHILATYTDPRQRRKVIMQLLGTYYHNFVTHLLEGELQRRIYSLAEKGEPITAATLSTEKGHVLREFWGDTVEIDDDACLMWSRQPHYYMGLYPYTYAAGLSGATAVAVAIREEGQPAVDRWLETLKAGGTLGPLELFQKAGVDMSSPEPIRRAVAYVGELVTELENSLGMEA